MFTHQSKYPDEKSSAKMFLFQGASFGVLIFRERILSSLCHGKDLYVGRIFYTNKKQSLKYRSAAE